MKQSLTTTESEPGRVAGEGPLDTAALLILRALAGKAGKVEIGSRQYTFSCIPTFQLRDDMTGRVHRCSDSTGLYRTIVSLSRGGSLPCTHGWK